MVVSSKRSLLPRAAEKTISLRWLVPVGVLIWTIPIVLGYPTILVLGLLFSALIGVGILYLLGGTQSQRIVQKRQNDSICTFARAFDYRQIDTRIIRAVYEEVQHWHGGKITNFPVRTSDHLDKDLHIDPEDIEDMALSIATRTKRSMDNADQNPFCGKVQTVEDLVLFFSSQPLKA